MKKHRYILLISFISLLALLSFPVGAMGNYQATATRDYRTPPVTPTDYDPQKLDINFDCPDGLPSGWGEVEPDPSWLSTCGACVPSPTPPFSEYVADYTGSNLECNAGYLPCRQISEETIVFGGFHGGTSTWGQFSLRQTSDIYVYIAFNNYVVSSVTEYDVFPDEIEISIDGIDILDTITYPVSEETVYEYQTSIEVDLGTVPSSGLTFTAVGLGDFNQSFGCTRAYVSLVPFSDFEEVSCPRISSCFTASTQTPQPTPTYVTNAFSSPSITQTGCDSQTYTNYGNGYKLDFSCSVSGAGDFDTFEFHWNESAGTGTTYIVMDGRCTGSQWYTYPLVESNDGMTFNDTQLWSTGNAPSTCSGSWVHTTGTRNYGSSNPQYIIVKNASAGVGTSSTFEGTIYIQPQTVFPTAQPGSTSVPCGLTATPVSMGSPITGDYCASVLPYDPTPDLDFDLFDEGPKVCTQIPYFSLVESMPDWLVAVIADDFITFMNSWAYFSASTFCYHSVDFRDQYVINVQLSLGVIMTAVLGVWFMRRITSKSVD